MKQRILKIAVVTVLTGLAVCLASCGGSHSSSSNGGASGAASDNGGSSNSSGIQISGVAAQDSPVVGVPVTVTDSTGKTVQSAATDSQGRFQVAVTGKAPYVLTVPVVDADGTPAVLSSVIAPAGGQGTVTANLNPLTSLITQRLLGALLLDVPSGNQIVSANITQASIGQAASAVNGVLQPLYNALGVPASATQDPVGAAYSTNASNPLSNLFAIVHITVHTETIDAGNGTGGANTATHQSVQIPLSGAMPQALSAGAVAAVAALNAGPTVTPIQHLVVIVGENQTFDTLFGTWQPGGGQRVKNLLSQGIVNADGSPGPNFSLALQNQASAPSSYTLNPTRTNAYPTLPPPMMIGMVNLSGVMSPSMAFSFFSGTTNPDFTPSLPNGPFQISKYTNGYASTCDQAMLMMAGGTYPSNCTLGQLYSALGIYAMTGDPVHRFFQMWQQTGGNNAKLDLYAWVAMTTGQGVDTANIGMTSDGTRNIQIVPGNTGQGGELMGFMNMAAGDAPYLSSLARQNALSDNYHQSVMGGTGMNFFSLATGDLPWFNNNGAVATPFANQIENPNPQSGTTNFYTRDGYQGGSYVNCADSSQPGVSAILNFLSARNIPSNCEAGKYYLVNNYNPGYDIQGNLQPIGANNYNFPPQTVPTIAEALQTKGVSWGWYVGARDATDVQTTASKLAGMLGQSPSTIAGTLQAAQYPNNGDPLLASKNVMTNPTLKGQLQNMTAFLTAAQSGTLPAVSFVVPPNLNSGHPGFSSPATYEAFLQTLIGAIQSNPSQYANTAILVTTDEGGGYFDTGPIQTLDFFGDGPRIPMLVISPFARKGVVDHTYHDHGSILKFIEYNWRLKPLSARSRDRLPNAVMKGSGYVPINNTPTIGNLTTMFSF